jgi:hypothetical protein
VTPERFNPTQRALHDVCVSTLGRGRATTGGTDRDLQDQSIAQATSVEQENSRPSTFGLVRAWWYCARFYRVTTSLEKSKDGLCR